MLYFFFYNCLNERHRVLRCTYSIEWVSLQFLQQETYGRRHCMKTNLLSQLHNENEIRIGVTAFELYS